MPDSSRAVYSSRNSLLFSLFTGVPLSRASRRSVGREEGDSPPLLLLLVLTATTQPVRSEGLVCAGENSPILFSLRLTGTFSYALFTCRLQSTD